ncbi:MAG: glycosyltransferase, partial [Chthoniobacteraceae bacterium]
PLPPCPVHNMPDVLVFSALVPKILGAKVILDLHDPMPELMMTIFGIPENSFAVRFMKQLEKFSIWFADAAVTVNLACKKIFSSRSCRGEKVHVVMNSPDERIFKYHDAEGRTASPRSAAKPFVLMYHGSLVERHGLDLAVQAVGSLKQSIPGIELRVYGRSTLFLEHVMESVRRDGLQDQVTFLPERNLEQIVEAIDECDLGIIPNRRSIFTELNTPTRIFEYLSRGKPVVAPAAPGIQDYFPDNSLVFFNLGDASDLAKKIEYVFGNPAEVNAIVRRGQGVYSAHRWAAERAGFVDLVSRLVKGRRLASVE